MPTPPRIVSKKQDVADHFGVTVSEIDEWEQGGAPVTRGYSIDAIEAWRAQVSQEAARPIAAPEARPSSPQAAPINPLPINAGTLTVVALCCVFGYWLCTCRSGTKKVDMEAEIGKLKETIGSLEKRLNNLETTAMLREEVDRDRVRVKQDSQLSADVLDDRLSKLNRRLTDVEHVLDSAASVLPR